MIKEVGCLLFLALFVQGQDYGHGPAPSYGPAVTPDYGYGPASAPAYGYGQGLSYGYSGSGEPFIYGTGYKKGPLSSGYGLHSYLPGVYALKHSGPRAPVYGDNYRYKYGYNWPARYVYPGHAKRFFLSRGDQTSRKGRNVDYATTIQPSYATQVVDSYGAAGYGADSYGAAGYAADSYGNTGYGADSYGAAGYGAAGYGVDSYSAAGYGADSYSAAGYGADSYGAVGYGADSYGANTGYGVPAYGYGSYKSSGPVIVNTNKVPVYGGHSWAGVYQGYGINAPKSPYGVLVSGNLYPTYVYKNIGYGSNAGNFGGSYAAGSASYGTAPVYGGSAPSYGGDVAPVYGGPVVADYGNSLPAYGGADPVVYPTATVEY